jgi:predicted nucleotide-binding protein
LVSRSEMDQAIANRLDSGRELLDRRVELSHDPSRRRSVDLDSLRDDFNTWDEYNEQLLVRRFSTAKVADGYRRMVMPFSDSDNPQRELKWLMEDISRQIRKLESIRGQLELYESEVPDVAATTAPLTGHKVFIVHGHDGDTKLQVAEFIQKITGERPIILHEQPDSGLTVIEKFETHASEAGFVAVLLTADDVGGVKGSTDQRPRARQNVVFEFGYFIGKLGRGRVVALYESGVELPSDVTGMLYAQLSGNWHTKLAKELDAAGIEVDLRKAL